MQVKDLEIDLLDRTVRQNGNLVKLTATEWELLRCLALNAGRVVAKEELLVSVWGPEYQDAEAYLRVWIPRLRKRLGSRAAAEAIKTINGIGYVLDIC
jgi:two-component system KDP operon response regulator KdpE